MSIHDLAKTTFVSTTTIIRLCKKLNLEGYSHLKYFLRDKAVSSQQEENIYASRSLQELLAEELSDIEHTAKAIDLHAVNEIAALMHQKTQIHFFAKGLTSIVFEYASRHLLSLSRHVTLYQDTHIAYIQAEQLTQNDIVFLASLSGETEQVVRVAQIARARNAKTVVFTVNPTSRLAKLGDYHFHLVNDATTTLDVDTKSRCQLMLILNIIIKAFVQQSTFATTDSTYGGKYYELNGICDVIITDADGYEVKFDIKHNYSTTKTLVYMPDSLAANTISNWTMIYGSRTIAS